MSAWPRGWRGKSDLASTGPRLRHAALGNPPSPLPPVGYLLPVQGTSGKRRLTNGQNTPLRPERGVWAEPSCSGGRCRPASKPFEVHHFLHRGPLEHAVLERLERREVGQVQVHMLGPVGHG